MGRLGFGFFLIFFSYSLTGQENLSFYHHKNNIEKLHFNPALYKDELPNAQLSFWGVGFGSDSNFMYSDLIHKGSGALSDSLVVDIPKFKEALSENNHLSLSANTTLFHFFVRVGPKSDPNAIEVLPHYFSFSIRHRVMGGLHFNKNYVELLTQGNAPFYSDHFETGEMGANMFAFTELSVAHGRQINERLWAGMRMKFLQGLYDVTTDHFTLGLQGYELENYVDVYANAAISISGPLTVGFDNNGFLNDLDFQSPETLKIFSNGNPGFAVDFGLVYELSKDLFFSMSVTDLGRIRWRRDVQQLTLDTQYRYEPLDFSNSYDENAADYISPETLFDDLTEDMKQSFVWNEKGGSYTRNLPSKFYAGLQYKWTPGIDLGLAYLNQKIGNDSYQSITASANLQILNTLNFSPTYMNRNGNSLWACALGLNVGPLQIYTAFSDLSGIESPAHAYAPEVQLGFMLRMDKSLRFLKQQLAGVQ